MNTQKSDEELVRKFGNDLGFQLKPSNDTMEAVRLARKLLPDLITTIRQEAEERERTLLTNLADEVEESRPTGVSVIREKGSEFMTPRMYRTLGIDQAKEEATALIRSKIK